MLIERFLVALAIGLLMGLERGWQQRNVPDGRRFAGLRTFGLLSLLGATASVLTAELGGLILAGAFIAVTALVIAAHVLESRQDSDVGITTPVAALLTFSLGAAAGSGHMTLASGVAVISAALMAMKPLLHRWVSHLRQEELYAIFKMLLISVVMLPVLPDQGYGPWQVLNPYEIWWMVVLITGISFAGYFAIRIAGQRRGLLATGLFGGLASSTAVTLSLSRIAADNRELSPLLAAGVILAAGTMFPRMLIEIGVVNAALLRSAALPLLVMMLISYMALPLLLWRNRRMKSPGEVPITNPFEITPALKFAVLLVAVLLLAEAAREWFDDEGIYAVAALSGLTDVDAITLSLARMARERIDSDVAVLAIVIAACVNTLVKGVLASVIGGRELALPVLGVTLCTVAGGLLTVLLT